MKLSIVVPIYNERDNVRPLYDALVAVLVYTEHVYEIILVDDGSTDGSAEEMDRLARLDGAVKIVRFRRNFGQTAAMMAGIDHASGEVIVTIDGDLQNDPADIPEMVAKLDEGYDLVHGWRQQRYDALVSRKIPSKLANWLIARVTGFPVHDLGCTLKAIRREIAQDLRMYGNMHRFIPILAHWQGARCTEMITRHHPRRFGRTKYGLWRTFHVLLDLLTVKFMIRYSASPMKLFGGLGLACGGLCAAALAATAAMKLSWSVDMTGNPLLLLSGVLGVAAIQFAALGLLGEVCTRIYHECQGKRPYRVRELVNFAEAREGGASRRTRAA
jgi:glycosyltransferase involved in cell wall biosynthesis